RNVTGVQTCALPIYLSDHYHDIVRLQTVGRRDFNICSPVILTRNNVQIVFRTDSQFLNTVADDLIRDPDLTYLHTVVQRYIVEEVPGNQSFAEAESHVSFGIDNFRADLLQHSSLLLADGFRDYFGNAQLHHSHGCKDGNIHLLANADDHHIAVL